VYSRRNVNDSFCQRKDPHIMLLKKTKIQCSWINCLLNEIHNFAHISKNSKRNLFDSPNFQAINSYLHTC
jgi:hypothetical protein